MTNPRPGRVLSTQVGRNTLVSSAGHGVRLALQAVYFVVLARVLGPAEYGAFVAVTAVTGILIPFASWGVGDRIVRAVAKDGDSFAREWGAGLTTTLLVGAFLSLALWWIGVTFFPATLPPGLVLPVALADLIAWSTVSVSASAFQAHERMAHHSAPWLLVSGIRAVTAVVVITNVSGLTAPEWALWYAAATIVAALLALTLVVRTLGRPALALETRREEWRDGFYYATGLGSLAVSNDIDKTMLADLQGPAAAGLYGVGYRAISIVMAPVIGLLDSTYSRFFQAGAISTDAVGRLLGKSLVAGLAYAVPIGGLLWLAAPLLPLVVGAQYTESTAVVRWLALLPALKTVQLLVANALLGLEKHRFRTWSQLGMAAGNIGLNLWLIPRFGWAGAAAATLASEGVLAVILAIGLVRLLRRKG